MSFFQSYPKLITKSLLQNNTSVELVDLFRKVKISNSFLDITTNYINYQNNTVLRPEQISYNIYGSTEYFWLILLANNITNIENDWALTDEQLEKVIEQKYKNPNKIYIYKTIEIKINNTVVLQKDLIVPENYVFIHNNITYINRQISRSVTYREYEIDKNENKKSLKIIKPQAIRNIKGEFNKLIQYQSKNNLDSLGRKPQEV